MASNSGGKPPPQELTVDEKAKQEHRKSIDHRKSRLASIAPPTPIVLKQRSQRGVTEERATALETQAFVQKHESVTAAIKAVNTKSSHKLEAAKKAEQEALIAYEAKTRAEKQKQADLDAKKKRDEGIAAQKKRDAEVAANEKKHEAELAVAKKRYVAAAKNRPIQVEPNILADISKKTAADKMSAVKPNPPSLASLKPPQNKSDSNGPSKTTVPTPSSISKWKNVSTNNKFGEDQLAKSNKSVRESRDMSFHDELTPTAFNNYDGGLTFGPDAFLRNYQWYQKRRHWICYSLSSVVVALAALTGVIQYSLVVIPDDLASSEVVYSIFYPQGSYVYFNCWGPVAVGYTMCVFGVVLIQWPKVGAWKRLGKLRWVIQGFLALHLINVFIYYCSRLRGINTDIEEVMKNDIKTNNGVRLQVIQKYFQCCGINSPKDWRPLIGLRTNWTGKLCSNPEYNMMDNPKFDMDAVCDVPSSCWNVTGQDWTDREHLNVRLWPESCLTWEIAMTYSVISVYLFILFGIIVALTTVFHYLRRLIIFSDKNNIELKPLYQFEECL